MLFVNPYTWSPNEAITSQKLNYLGQYLTTYLNGANIAPSQLSSPYANTVLPFTIPRYPAASGTFLAATEDVYYPLTLPASNWNFVVEKVALTCFAVAGTGANATFDIQTPAGVSVLVGPAPNVTVSNTEVANTNAITLSSSTKYLMKLSFFGDAAANQAYAGVCAVVYGKMLLRS